MKLQTDTNHLSAKAIYNQSEVKDIHFHYLCTRMTMWEREALFIGMQECKR